MLLVVVNDVTVLLLHLIDVPVKHIHAVLQVLSLTRHVDVSRSPHQRGPQAQLCQDGSTVRCHCLEHHAPPHFRGTLFSVMDIITPALLTTSLKGTREGVVVPALAQSLEPPSRAALGVTRRSRSVARSAASGCVLRVLRVVLRAVPVPAHRTCALKRDAHGVPSSRRRSLRSCAPGTRTPEYAIRAGTAQASTVSRTVSPAVSTMM